MICSPVTPVRTDAGVEIAARALALVGTPFRLHGRSAAGGLDCVGLVALACGLPVPDDYTLRGAYQRRILAFFDRDRFSKLSSADAQPGDIWMMQPGPRQAHFAVLTARGAVHAHAGLGRVVLSPLPLPWPVFGRWRFIGD